MTSEILQELKLFSGNLNIYIGFNSEKINKFVYLNEKLPAELNTTHQLKKLECCLTKIFD